MKIGLMLGYSIALLGAPLVARTPAPAAIFTDPAHDAKHPARMEVLHIPSGGGMLNGVAYVAAGTILISAANIGGLKLGQAHAADFMAENMESLATTAQAMADEVEQRQPMFDWMPQAAGLARRPLLILSSDDGLAPGTDALASAVRGAKGSQVTTLHVATDHSWSDRRIRLETEVIRWLATLKRVPQ